MKESHFRGLEESSYLGGDREKTLSFYFLFVWVKLPTKQNEKKNTTENGAPSFF